MTANVPVKAISAAELSKLRGEGTTVFTALINQATPLTGVTEFIYDNSVGSTADVKIGMVISIGSAAGLADRGTTHVTATPSGTVIYCDLIGFTFANNDFVTIRTPGNQSARLGMYVQSPSNIYTMRVNQTFTTLDSVTALTYDGGSGTTASVKLGMTVLVSATAYGKHDKGICRVRGTISATTGSLKINETSDIQFADNDYLTIINAFSIWQKDYVVNSGVVLMDNEIEYFPVTGASGNGGVLPRLGPICAVIFRTAGTVDFTPVSAALSAAYDGATLASYAWSCYPTAAGLINSTTATPTFTFTAAGEYRITCAITDSESRVTTGHRWVIVDPTSEEFELLSCQGSFDSGGWRFKARTHSSIGDVYDRAMVVLYTTREVYGETTGAIGKLAGYENILSVGWIDGETIAVNPQSGYVDFEVKGADFWLSKIRTAPFGSVDTSVTAENWSELYLMTVDKALFHLLFWSSTISLVMDCFFTADTNRIQEISSPAPNLWEQLKGYAFSTLQAAPLVNNLGQMFIERDTQFLSTADVAALTVVQDITQDDYQTGFSLSLAPTERTARVELSGVTAWDGSNSDPVFSRAPGTIGSTYGDVITEENYLFVDQDDCNRIAGCFYAIANNLYGPLDIDLPAQNKFIDICPRQLCTMTIAAADNPLGVALTAMKLIPRSVNYTYDASSGFLGVQVEFELSVTSAVVSGITFIPPTPVVDNIEEGIIGIDDLGFEEFPSLDLDFPPYIAPAITAACVDPVTNNNSLPWSLSRLNGTDSSALVADIYLPCKVLGSGAHAAPSYPTTLNIFGTWHNDAGSNYHVYAMSGGAIVLTAALASMAGGKKATFSPLSDTAVDGFRITLDAGSGTPPFYLTAFGELLEDDIPMVPTTNSSVCVNGNYYIATAKAGIGAYWDCNETAGNQYNFARHPDNTSFEYGVGYTQEYAGGAPGMSLQVPSGCYQTWARDGFYAATAFISGTAGLVQFQFKLADLFASGIVNHGMVGQIYQAVLDGRSIDLGSCVIKNVCAP